MLPSRYVSMPVFPKTINGKIDRDALPEANTAVIARRTEAVAAQNDTERKLVSIWCDILSLPDISIDDSFISLGGDSLMAIRAIARIQKDMNFTISTRDFFFLDTVALLAGHMEGKAVQRRVPAPEPAFINSRGRQIYTVLQRPEEHNDNGRGLLLVPPLGNEQRRVQRPLRNLMQNLSRQGYTLMRFDWRGTANSGGSTDQINSLQPWIEDLEDAAEQLATQVNSIDIVAIRFGALIAALTPATSTPVNCRYYWDPIVSGEQWLTEMEALQNGIVNDTYRFLTPRKKHLSKYSEYAGIAINDVLKDELKRQSFKSHLTQGNWNRAANLMVPTSSKNSTLKAPQCQLHTIDESNDWTNPRTTNADMNINKAASLLVDLLDKTQDSTAKAHTGIQRNAATNRTPNPVMATNLEQACAFGENGTLTGVYTPPLSTDSSEPCALYLTAGLLHHVGPTRLHVEMARALSKQNVAGLRFDLSGVGDSETSSMGGYFVDRSINEIQQAMDFLEKQYGHKRFVLIGLCSGADDALATAQVDKRVSGIVLLNGYAYKAGLFFINRLKIFYLPRLFMWQKVRKKLIKLFHHDSNDAKENETKENRIALAELDDDFRYIPPQAETEKVLEKLANSKSELLFVYAGSEHDDFTYKGQFFAMFPALRGNAQVSVQYLQEADHTLILSADRNKVTNWACEWFASASFSRNNL